MLLVQFVLIGGQFDGVRSIGWASDDPADDEAGPPEQIVVGHCRGRGRCGSQDCVAGSPPHIAWWDCAEELAPPVRVVQYVRVELETNDLTQTGVARYVHTGIDVRAFLETREPVLAGGITDMDRRIMDWGV